MDLASNDGLITGYAHDSVDYTKAAYACGEVHENRAGCRFALRKTYLRMFRGISTTALPGYVGFFPFLCNVHRLPAFEQARMILYPALDPGVASGASQGPFVKRLDFVDLLQSPRH